MIALLLNSDAIWRWSSMTWHAISQNERISHTHDLWWQLPINLRVRRSIICGGLNDGHPTPIIYFCRALQTSLISVFPLCPYKCANPDSWGYRARSSQVVASAIYCLSTHLISFRRLHSLSEMIWYFVGLSITTKRGSWWWPYHRHAHQWLGRKLDEPLARKDHK